MIEIKKSIFSELLTCWDISPEFIPSLDRYYILHWQTEYFNSQKKGGVIEHQGKEYLILYHKCLPAALQENAEIYLSFRLFKAEIYPYGYVLVTPKFQYPYQLTQFKGISK